MWQEIIVGIIIVVVFYLIARHIFALFAPKRGASCHGCDSCALNDKCHTTHDKPAQE